MKFSIKISALAFLIVLNLIIKAQQTQAYSDKDALYNAALELLDKKLYGSAQKKFVEYANENPNSILKSNLNENKTFKTLSSKGTILTPTKAFYFYF